MGDEKEFESEAKDVMKMQLQLGSEEEVLETEHSHPLLMRDSWPFSTF